ncbi:MAG: hypothetical protein RL719_321, partial [Actinomycetota bacterium]
MKSRLVVPALAVGAVGAALVALWLTGAMQPALLADPGDLVRWTQPAFKALTNIAMAVAIGSSVFAAFAVADNSPQLKRALNLIAASSVAWVVCGLVSYVLTYLTIAGTEIGFGASFTAGLNIFMFQIALGQSMAINLLFGAALATLALMVSTHKATVFLAIIGLASLIPMAVSGHAAGSADHAAAVNSIGMHLVAIVVWVGGLVALVVTAAGAPAGIRVDLLRRFSSLALIAFV